MLAPSPDHPITVMKYPRSIRVLFNGTVVAESANALKLQEADYRPVFYIPREDARMEYFTHSDHTSRYPYKGRAAYFSLEVAGKRSENAVWSYETPYPAVDAIREFVAFYPSKVDAIEEF